MTMPFSSSNFQQGNGGAAGPERLESWKEIASYLRREVRTVQLWEKKEGLPVHRHFHRRLGSVFAFRSEIEEWVSRASRKSLNSSQGATAPTARSTEPSDCATICVATTCEVSVSTERRDICNAIIDRVISALRELKTGILFTPQQDQPVLPSENVELAVLAAPKAFDYILKWNIQEKADVLRLVTTLLSPNNVIVGRFTYTYDPQSFSETPTDIADQIAQCLWLKLISAPKSAPVAVHRQGAASREAYLKGRYLWNQRSERGMRNAIRCFESAIREDPQFAPAYSGLADSFTLLSFYEIVSPSETMPAARQAALRAIELDPNLAEAHASLADILLHFERDWQAADREYRRAIQCNPTYALGYHWYANLLSARGQHTAAQVAIMHALEIDPVSLITRVWAGVTSHLAHRFDDAIKYYESALELDPHFIWAHMYMAQTLEQLGNFDEALREFETTLHLTGGSNCVRAMKAHAHAAAGDESSAYRILNELSGSFFSKCPPSYDIAATYAALGESDQMVIWLDRACTERNMKLFTLFQDPRFDPLRNTQQFKKVIERTGFAQADPAHQVTLN